MMHWLDRFCRYKTFGTTELHLKSYRVLKFQELDCKIAGASS
jgi:hypothetical protein